MTLSGWAQLALMLAALAALTPLLGGYMARVYGGQPVALGRALGPLERRAYRLFGVDAGEQQDWKHYARSLIIFSAVSWLALYAILRTQGAHPLNPQGFGPGPWDLSFNTASSFVSNTSWQYYAGETTLSYFSQMTGIAVASFMSAAVGMSVAVALIRGLSRRGTGLLGNFWVDLTRSLGPRRVAPAGPGTLRTDTPTFAVVLTGVVVLLALLSYLVALCLGPLVQSLSSDLY